MDVQCLRDHGFGRPLLIIGEIGWGNAQQKHLMLALADILEKNNRIVLVETPLIDHSNWEQVASAVRTMLRGKRIRSLATISFGHAAIIVQQMALIDNKFVRSMVCIDGVTRPHPGSITRVAQWIEQHLPLGLPLRSVDRGFDSKSFLHRIRCPVLIVASHSADHHQRVQASLLLQGLPTAWEYEIDDTKNPMEFASKIEAFQEVLTKCPQRRIYDASNAAAE